MFNFGFKEWEYSEAGNSVVFYGQTWAARNGAELLELVIALFWVAE